VGSTDVLYLTGPGIEFRPGDILSRLRCSVIFFFPFKQIPGPSGIRRRLPPSTSSPLHYVVGSRLLTLCSISNIIKCAIHQYVLFWIEPGRSHYKTPCSYPIFGSGLKIKLLLWNKCQVTENAPNSKKEYVTLRCLMGAVNECGAMMAWGLAEKNTRSSEKNCFSALYPSPVSHNVTGDWSWGSTFIQIRCLCLHTMIYGLCLSEIVTARQTHIVLSSITPCDLPWRWNWYFFLKRLVV